MDFTCSCFVNVTTRTSYSTAQSDWRGTSRVEVIAIIEKRTYANSHQLCGLAKCLSPTWLSFSLSGYGNNIPYPGLGFAGRQVREDNWKYSHIGPHIHPSFFPAFLKTNCDVLVITLFCTAGADDPVVLQQQCMQIPSAPHTRDQSILVLRSRGRSPLRNWVQHY